MPTGHRRRKHVVSIFKRGVAYFLSMTFLTQLSVPLLLEGLYQLWVKGGKGISCCHVNMEQFASYDDNPETLLHYVHGIIAPRYSEKAGALCQGRPKPAVIVCGIRSPPTLMPDFVPCWRGIRRVAGGSRLQHTIPSRAAPTIEPVALVLRSALLSDSSWSRHNCNIELRGKPDKFVTAMLLHLDSSLVLKSFSDWEEVCLSGASDADAHVIFRLPDVPSVT